MYFLIPYKIGISGYKQELIKIRISYSYVGRKKMFIFVMLSSTNG